MRISRASFAALTALLLTTGCFAPPQMGPDKEAFTTIDALYSAVSLREPVQLERCAKTLDDLHAAERLPKSAHQVLQGFITEARAGQWKASQENLRRFMLGQHR